MSSESHRRKPIDTLSRSNWEEWFSDMQDWLIAEDIFGVITGVDNTLDSTFSRSDAKARYWIKLCIDKDDKERIRDLQTAKSIWHRLQGKYKEKLPSAGEQYLIDLVNFQMTSETSIDQAWTHIATLSRKVAETSPALSAMSTMQERFKRLLASLPIEFITMKDSIQVNMPETEIQIDIALDKLQEKEAQLGRSPSAAFYAKKQNRSQSYSKSQGQSQSQSQFQSQPTREKSCKLCKSSKHWMTECPSLEIAQKIAQQERKARAVSKRPTPAQDESYKRLEDKVDRLFKILQDVNISKFQKAFVANETSESSAKSTQESNSEPQEFDEVVHFSKEASMDHS